MVNKDNLTEEEFLAKYNPGDWDRPSFTTDILIFTINKTNNKLELLLIKRKDHPYINKWAIPGGFVNIDETAETAALRELKEETGIDNVYLEQLYTYTDVNRDPRMRVISTSYIALVDKDLLSPMAGDDAEDCKWFSITKDGNSGNCLILQSDDITIKYNIKKIENKNGKLINFFEDLILTTEESLAFDHCKIINDAINRLRNKVEYTDIAFNLLPDEFTLPELQLVYEILLGKSLYKTSFRNKIKDLVVETTKTNQDKNRRPAIVYKYKNKGD